MKKIVLIVLCIVVHAVVYGQFGQMSKKELAALKSTPLKVVLNDNDDTNYSAALKKAMDENWTFTKFEFITENELASQYQNKENVNLFGYFTGTYSQSTTSGVNNYSGVTFIGPVNKYRSKHQYQLGRDSEVFMVYPNDGIEEEYLEGYLALNVRVLDNYFTKLESDPKVFSYKSYLKQIEKISGECKKKKILLCEEDLYDSNTDILNKYKFNYEVVSREQINSAILEKKDVLVYYLIPSVKYAYHYFISAKDGTVYYYNVSIGGSYQAVQKKLFKDLAKK